MKKFLILALVLALAQTLMAGGGGQQSASPSSSGGGAFSGFNSYKIKVAHFFGDTHPQHLSLLEFKKEVEAKSEGKITVEVYPNGQLGPEDVYIDSVKQGTVEMGAAGTLMARDVPAVMIAEMPFLFDSFAQAKGTIGGDIGRKIYEPMVQAIGVRVLACTANGFREVSSNKPIQSLADFKGVRLRVPNTPVYIKMFQALGVNPVAMPLTEVFTALEQKVVDGQDNPYATVHASSFNEVQTNIIETRHMFSPAHWIMNEKFYQSLPAEFKNIVDTAAKNAADYNWKISEQMDTSEKQWLKDNKIKIYEPDAATKKQLVDAMVKGGVYEWFYQQYPGTKEIEAQIRAFGK